MMLNTSMGRLTRLNSIQKGWFGFSNTFQKKYFYLSNSLTHRQYHHQKKESDICNIWHSATKFINTFLVPLALQIINVYLFQY